MVQKSETPEMRKVLAKKLGVYSWWATLEPTGKEVLANIFVAEKKGGIEISLGLRLRIKKSTTDKLRRMTPPPTAIRIGLRKFWSELEKELGSGVTQASARPASKAVILPKVTKPGAKPQGDNPDGIAVIIGNKNYVGRVPQVDFAHNDATAMKRFVIEILGVHEGNIMDLRDVKLAEMEDVLGNSRTHRAKLWQWVRPHESDVFIFYSGHGVPGLKDGREYLLPVDGDPNKAEIKGYPVELLYKNLDKLEARSVTVLMDACFSGESPHGPLIRDASGIRVVPKRRPAVQFTVISSSQRDQTASWDKKAKQGLFTKCVLEALYGAADGKRYGNADRQITLGEIKAYLDREMTYAARRHYGREQQAMVSGDPEKVMVVIGK
ncbi:MAG: caspase family protein [Deltaproteobacteria bacterium]|nr:caspase family protein [Deltaproteobacteria bacterium]